MEFDNENSGRFEETADAVDQLMIFFRLEQNRIGFCRRLGDHRFQFTNCVRMGTVGLRRFSSLRTESRFGVISVQIENDETSVNPDRTER
jgi:hypothetical protein